MVRIFLVDDDPFFGEMLKYHLQLNPDYEVFLYSSGKNAFRALPNPDIICIDLVYRTFREMIFLTDQNTLSGSADHCNQRSGKHFRCH
jgi:DNA-binding response OmpR family regulator